MGEAIGDILPLAVGMAIAARIDRRSCRVFALLGDGECAEGSVWEAAISAHRNRLANLTVLVDRNHMQCYGPTEEVGPVEPFADKWQSFGWEVVEVDGHDHDEIIAATGRAPIEEDRPTVIIAHTTKGKGVSFMEDTVLWHYRSPQGEEYEAAMKELEEMR